jgi:hypothetical protein
MLASCHRVKRLSLERAEVHSDFDIRESSSFQKRRGHSVRGVEIVSCIRLLYPAFLSGPCRLASGTRTACMPPDQIPTCPRRVVGFAECFSGEDATEKRVFGMDWQFQTNVVPMSLPVSGGPCAVLRLRPHLPRPASLLSSF